MNIPTFKNILVFALILAISLSAGFCRAQNRESEPLPVFSEKPLAKLQNGLTGWCYSLDGQWVTSNMKIPMRFISTDKKSYYLKENILGADNIKELQLFAVEYDEDTLVMLVKFYKDGSYEFENIKKNWDEKLIAYYYIFKKSELDRLKESINAEVQILSLNLLDYGEILDADRFETVEQIRPNVVIDPGTQRKLQFTVQKNYPENKIRFQFASVFPYTQDLEGVRHDLTLNGESLYGKPLLLDYIYYECKAKILENFLRFETDSPFE